MIGCHAGALDGAITVDPVEIEDALWLTREEMVTVMAGAHPAIRAPRKGAIAHFLVAAWLADRLD
jgi:NAD+ diphosphatase